VNRNASIDIDAISEKAKLLPANCSAAAIANLA